MSLTRYLLEFSICLALFYGLYYFMLRRETFFQLNRWYLLLSPALSMIIPFVNFELPADPEPGNWDQMIIPIVSDIQSQQNIIWENLGSSPSPGWTLTYLDLILIIYGLGVWIMAFRLIKRTWNLLKLIGEGKQERRSGYTMVQTKEKLPASSFLSYVFWEEGELDPKRKKILEHELVHVRQWHSLDVLLMEIWVMLKWFHPLIHWYRNSLRLTHEYIADAYVSKLSGSRLVYAQLLTQTKPVGVGNHLLHQFNSSLKMRLLMLSKDQSEKWRYLKYLFIGPVTGVLFLLFSLNQSEPVAQTIDQAENLLSRAVNQPVIVNPALSEDVVDNYKLTWGNLHCACYNDQYPRLYYCEDKSLSPEKLRRLIRDNGGFQLSRGDAPQHILELTAVSKNMKDMGGFQGQFDEMGTDFRKDSPLWEQAEVGDIFRFTFKNGQEDHFQFEVVISNASKNYSFGEKLVIGRKTYDLINFKTHFEHAKRGGRVEMDMEEFKQLMYEPLRIQKDDQSYFIIDNISLMNEKAMRSDTQQEVNRKSVDLSRMQSILDARPGDDLRVRMSTAKGEHVDFFIRIKKDPALNSDEREVRIEWGDKILEKEQHIILSKDEIDKLLNEDMYLLYNGKHKVLRETEMNSFYFTSDNMINPIRYQDLFRSILQKVKPGEPLILGGMVTTEGYVMPGFRIHVDFNWREIFNDHPNAAFSKDGHSVSITDAKPEDLVTVLALKNFSPVPYRIEVDGVEYITDDKRDNSLIELLDHQLPRKSLKISRRFTVGQ